MWKGVRSMRAQDHIRRLLEENRGASISGEEVARTLGVSRCAVWKAVCALRQDGYPIEAATNRGYRLAPESDVLSEAGVRRYLSGDATRLAVEVLDEVSSTNQVLRGRALAGAPEGGVIVAAAQSSGRGRRGRSFFSPRGTGVYLSVLLRPDLAAGDAQLITTTAAVAVCEAIETVAGKEPRIKWVNDVYLDGKKVCGILTEAALDLEGGRVEYAVLGIGVNVCPPPAGFPPELAAIAGSVFDGPIPDARSRMAGEILSRFWSRYRAPNGLDALDAYRSRSLPAGTPITVLAADGEIPATVRGIDERCRLLVTYAGGTAGTLSSGEISIRVETGQ